MSTLMQSYDEAITLTPAGEGTLEATLTGDFSNAPIAAPPEAGPPFGGMIAALAAGAMRQGLGLEVPLQSLSVQYLSASRYGQPLRFMPRLLRGGRTVSYSALDVYQGPRQTHHATATWGQSADGPVITPLAERPPALDSLDPARQLDGGMSPRFTRHVDYRFADGPNLFGGNAGRAPVERVWMRMKQGGALDHGRLCYLLDALYPPSWTALASPPMMTTVDLRYDFLCADPGAKAPDGWAFFAFSMLDLGSGWTVDEVLCHSADGTPLALSRQRRKLL
jgi:acyl-coenzyme A thioesterase PaaI-like protein